MAGILLQLMSLNLRAHNRIDQCKIKCYNAFYLGYEFAKYGEKL